MKHLHRAGALALALIASLSLGGCVTFQEGFTGFEGDISSLFAIGSSPAANQTFANLKTGAEVFTCAVANVAAAAASIQTEVNKGQALPIDESDLLVVSSAVCGLLGGTVTGTTAYNPASVKYSPARGARYVMMPRAVRLRPQAY
jgi:hypothetical protein